MNARTLMLDSSTLVTLSREEDREHLAAALAEMVEAGWILVLTGHHFVEMLRHGDDEEAERRLAFLSWLSHQPGLAWIAAGADWESLGMIPHVTAAEVQAVAEGIGIFGLKSAVLNSLLRISAPPTEEFAHLSVLRPIFQAQMVRERQIASIVRSSGPDFGSETVGELRTKRSYPSKIAQERVLAQSEQLESKLRATGDRRLEDHAEVAREFLLSAAREIPMKVEDGETPADALIRSAGLDPSEVPDDLTFNDLAYLAEFRHKMALVARQADLPEDAVSDITIDQIPTCLIQKRLRIARVRSGAKASGGDLTDSYLASMALYIDLVIGDKRTVELMSQVKNNLDSMEIGCVRRLRALHELVPLLEEFGRQDRTDDAVT